MTGFAAFCWVSTLISTLKYVHTILISLLAGSSYTIPVHNMRALELLLVLNFSFVAFYLIVFVVAAAPVFFFMD